MKKSLRRIAAGLLCLSTLSALAACGAKEQAASATGATESSATEASAGFDGTVTIGTILPLTSAVGVEAERGVQGMQLAVSEINEAGGVCGRELKLLIEDDANTTETSVSLTRKMGENSDVKALIGPHTSVNLVASSPVIQEFKIPTTAASSSVSVYDLNNEYFFRCRPSDLFLSTSATKIAVDQLASKNVAVIYLNNDYGIGALNTIEETLEGMGMSLVASEGHSAGETDFTASLLKCQNAGADAIIVWSYPGESAIICRQFKELGLNQNITLLGGPSFCSQPFYDQIEEEYCDGTYTVSDFAVGDPDPEVQGFIKRFNEAYGVNPDLVGTAYYNAVYLFANTMNRIDSVEREDVAKALLDTDELCGSRWLKCDERRDLCHKLLILENVGSEPTIMGSIEE